MRGRTLGRAGRSAACDAGEVTVGGCGRVVSSVLSLGGGFGVVRAFLEAEGGLSSDLSLRGGAVGVVVEVGDEGAARGKGPRTRMWVVAVETRLRVIVWLGLVLTLTV